MSTEASQFDWMTIGEFQTMQSISRTEKPDNLESAIADVVVISTALARAGQKNRLKLVLAELARLKSQRSATVIHRLDYENGADDLP